MNLNTLNFDVVTVERFLKSEKKHEGYPSIGSDFLGSDYKGDRRDQGLIYGNITLVYIGNNTIMTLPDEYNFEMNKAELTKRNVLIFMRGMWISLQILLLEDRDILHTSKDMLSNTK